MRSLFFNVILFLILTKCLHSNNLALPCAGCHGPKGYSPGQTIPSINNLDRSYFIKAFNEYKSGIRDNYIMQIIARGYTDNQIQALAEYFGEKN